ncbi:unnamed protein product, partial [Rotaria magnacalcarata]
RVCVYVYKTSKKSEILI